MARTCVLLLLICVLKLAAACSDVSLVSTPYDAIISARNYDFFAEKVLTMQFSIMPARTSIKYTPLVGCSSPSGLTASQIRSKYGFICATVGRPEFVAGFWAGCGKGDYSNFRKCLLVQIAANHCCEAQTCLAALGYMHAMQ